MANRKLRRLETERLSPDQFLEHETTLSEQETKNEIRNRSSKWIFPTISIINVWVIVILTLSFCGVIEISESLIKWLISETIVTVLGFAGIMITWAFKK